APFLRLRSIELALRAGLARNGNSKPRALAGSRPWLELYRRYAAKNGQIPDPKSDTSSLKFFSSRYTLAIVTDNAPELRVQFTKRKDGSVVLRCVRKDGSATWQRHDKHATFFSYHDLSHFVVETT